MWKKQISKNYFGSNIIWILKIAGCSAGLLNEAVSDRILLLILEMRL
jgi:hypothetical protein